jgi:general secretion pathway protein M
VKDWFLRYNPREQLLLLLMAFFLGAYLLYFMVLTPVAAKRDEMAARNNAAVEVLKRVDGMVSEVLRLRNSSEGVSQKRNLTTLINQSTSALGLPVSRLQPNSRGEIQVRVENASFDDLLKWLHDMEFGQSLLVREVSITQAGSAGRVNASIRIAQG